MLRARSLLTLKGLMEQHFEEFARTIVQEHGKTIEDARGETRRAIENVEVAVGIPTLMQGYGLENVASGIDAEAVRQPIGVFGVIGPFNFPLMVPNWFIPYAIATGNTVVVKPSEQTPLSMTRMAELIMKAGIPPGVFNVVHGAKDASTHCWSTRTCAASHSLAHRPWRATSTRKRRRRASASSAAAARRTSSSPCRTHTSTPL